MHLPRYPNWTHMGVILLALACLAGGLCAGRSWGYFLDTASGVRAAGMGEAFAGLADDATAVLSNPGGLGQLEEVQLTSAYSDFYSQLQLASENGSSEPMGDMYLGAALPLGNHPGTVGVSWLRFFSRPYQENTFYLSYGHPFKLPDVFNGPVTLNVGSSLKYLYWALDYNDSVATYRELYPTLSKGGITADVGVLGRVGDTLRVGMAVENLVPIDLGMTEAEPLAAVYRLGISYPWRPTRYYLDIVQPTLEVSVRNQVYSTKVGMEVWGWERSAALRLGLNNDAFTGGLSYRAELRHSPLALRLDYALAYPFQVTGSWGTHRLGLTLFLNKPMFEKDLALQKKLEDQKRQQSQEQKALLEQSTHTVLFIEALAEGEDKLVQAVEHLRSEAPLSHETYLVQNSAVFTQVEHTLAAIFKTSSKLSAGAQGIFQRTTMICATEAEVYQSVSRTTKTSYDAHQKVERAWEKGYLSILKSKSDIVIRTNADMHTELVLEEQLSMVHQNTQRNLDRQKILGMTETLLDDVQQQMSALHASVEPAYLAYAKPSLDEGVASLKTAITEIQKAKHDVERELRVLGEKERTLQLMANFRINRQGTVVIGFETKYWAAFSTLTNEDQMRKNILGYLKQKSGLDILDQKYNSAEELERDFENGKIDLMVTGRLQAERLVKEGTALPMAGFIFKGNDDLAECLYVRENLPITTLNQLKGMRLGYLSTESYGRMEQLFSIPSDFFSEPKYLRDPKSALLALQVQQVDVILSDEYLATIYDVVKHNGVSLAKGIKKIAVAPGRVKNTPLLMRSTLTRAKLTLLGKLAGVLRQMGQDEQGRRILGSFGIEQIIPVSSEK